MSKPNIVDISIDGWDLTTSVFEKQTSAILEFYFRSRSRPLPVICVSFCITLPNFVQTGASSFPFFKMAAVTTKYQFRFRISWCHCLQKVKVYQRTKFRRHISIDGWDITTSGFEKQTSAILEFYFRFRSRSLPVICMSFCITLPNFVQIGATTAEIWRHFHFSRWRPRPLNTSSGFIFVDVTVFRRSKCISKTNLVDRSQLPAEI